MSNMSYCRFQNTFPDLQDCEEAMSENEPSEMAFEERLARWHLVRLCIEIAQNYEDEAEAPKPQREKA